MQILEIQARIYENHEIPKISRNNNENCKN